jgi:hypothetical protein
MRLFGDGVDLGKRFGAKPACLIPTDVSIKHSKQNACGSVLNSAGIGA